MTFDPGVISKTIDVVVKADTGHEPQESFKVVLSNPTGGSTIADDTGLVIIKNDD